MLLQPCITRYIERFLVIVTMNSNSISHGVFPFIIDENVCKKTYTWLCGLDHGEPGAVDHDKLEEERIRSLSSLKQSPRANLLLNINLGIICSVGLFLYIYFTFHKA